jgi:hypothetical protein
MSARSARSGIFIGAGFLLNSLSSTGSGMDRAVCHVAPAGAWGILFRV